jgi:hypothetical protein
MAHFSLLDRNNKVIQVIVGPDENSEDGRDWELVYQMQYGYKCKRTSYNTIGNQHINGGVPFRGNYAGIGFTYDENKDAFIPPQPFPSWELNETTFLWEPPIPMPEDGLYRWDEETLSWIAIEED